MRWSELSVEVGWGVLRGKTCVVGGATTNDHLKILCLHGWLDNANSFDTLVPLLPTGVEVLTFDLPGHGLSDHLPPGAHYNCMTYLLNVRLVVKKLGWQKFAFMLHSMGALIANYYTALFPEDVIALIQLDYMLPYHSQDIIATWRAEVKMLTEIKPSEKIQPLHTKDVAIQRLINARTYGSNIEDVSIDEDSAEILLLRSARCIDGGYRWCHDIRVHSRFIMLLGLDNWQTVISRITCPVLLLRATNGVCKFYPEALCKTVLETYSSSSRSFHYRVVNGGHHVHLTNPERVAPHLIQFLSHITQPIHLTASKL